MGISFALTATLRQRVNMSSLLPSKLQGLSCADIADIPLQSGNRTIRTGSIFAISGSDSRHLSFTAACNKLDFIGKELASGTITVSGDVGAYLGLQMRGGSIKVQGNADIYAGCEMAGGYLEIAGCVGDLLASSLPGSKQGMRGGTILVKGNAGARVGDNMRRGLVLIEGDAGDYLASRMLSGTIAVIGKTGNNLGYGMRRGTILLWQPPTIPPTFNNCGKHTLSFLPILFRSWQHLNSKFATAPFSSVHRYIGDTAALGHGEVLVKHPDQ